ncbi:hypothetical protein H9657_03245 [Cellulomonas sp. Sa3CUA2]|uniref:Peptidase S26 domain-containing protein n=1 Tax=Cellulomonas avistercoris TaxID=2762242 RepID=A0ABR8QA71_9CELL|nr:hypothetical protein [Cellulomonas avistercoris]MBD7917294.1 hypothetical protein [Cellulomonas avistercoris]
MSARSSRHAPARPGGGAANAGGTVMMLVYGTLAVLAAFLWPPSLGGCTSLDVVPPPAAGAGLAAGDLIVTRCDRPQVGDRVVHRAHGVAWSVGRVVDVRPDGWKVVRGAAAAERTVAHPDAVRVLPLRMPAAVVAPAAGAALIGAGVLVLDVGRRRRARRPTPGTP